MYMYCCCYCCCTCFFLKKDFLWFSVGFEVLCTPYQLLHKISHRCTEHALEDFLLLQFEEHCHLCLIDSFTVGVNSAVTSPENTVYEYDLY